MSDQIIERKITVERLKRDDEALAVPVVVATDSPIAGASGRCEVLSHAPDAVDLSRAKDGLPLLESHQMIKIPIGRVEHLRLDGGKLRGIARFSKGERGRELYRDVTDGIITDVSVGARVANDAWTERADGTLVAKRWTPIEASLVSVGADPGAGVNREEQEMYSHPDAAENPRADKQRERVEEIGALFNGLDGPKWVEMERDALRSDDPVAAVRQRVIDALKAETVATVDRSTPDTIIKAGRDRIENWLEQAEAALEWKFDQVAPERRAEAQRALADNELAGMTLREMARDYLRHRGQRATGSADRMVQRAMTLPALTRSNFSHSTSDFANLLAASADKSLGAGFAEAPETYASWTRNVTMSNFRQHTFPVLSTFGDLDQVPEGAEYEYGTFSEKVENATLATYGKLFSITRHAIVNDDLNAFTSIPMKMGRAAARQVGDLVYNILTQNSGVGPTMNETSRALFNTTDSTLAASGGAITTATLNTARTAMRTQTDPGGATLNVMPRYLIVPAALETTARVQMASEKDPAEGSTTSFDAINPFRNAFDVVVEPRLDAASTTAWHLFASPGGEVDTVVVGWLNGNQQPFLDQEDGFNVDGVKYKVRIDCTAAALDYRGAYRNAGA